MIDVIAKIIIMMMGKILIVNHVINHVEDAKIHLKIVLDAIGDIIKIQKMKVNVFHVLILVLDVTKEGSVKYLNAIKNNILKLNMSDN